MHCSNNNLFLQCNKRHDRYHLSLFYFQFLNLAFVLKPYPEPYISCMTILNIFKDLPEDDEHTHMEQCSVYIMFHK